MRLKLLTNTLVLTGVILMLAWPFVIGGRPSFDTPRKVKIAWGRKTLIYFGATSAVWVSAATAAVLLARQTRRNFLEQERANLKSLVEGTLRDHGRQS